MVRSWGKSHELGGHIEQKNTNLLSNLLSSLEFWITYKDTYVCGMTYSR